MSVFTPLLKRLTTAFLSNISDADISMLARQRFGATTGPGGVVPDIIPERIITLEEWQAAVNAARNPYFYNRRDLQRIYDGAMGDLHLFSIVDTRIKKVQTAKYKLIDAEGNEDAGAASLFAGQWYIDFLKYALESVFYGPTLVELVDQARTPSVIKLNGKSVSYKPLLSTNLIPRPHVRPEEGVFVVRTFDQARQGIDFTTSPFSNYYLLIGNPHELGMLKILAPYVIAKKFALGAWSEFDDKLGIPFRWVNMMGTDKRRESMLAKIMAQMGSAGWAILHPGEEIKMLEAAGTDVHKCFKELIETINSETSKAVLGQTMTTDNGSSKAQVQVHQDVANDRHEADRTFVEYLINEQLIPRLIYLGYPLEGYRYERDNKREIPLEQQILIDAQLLLYYNIDPQYIADKYDIPLDMLEDKPEPELQQTLADAAKKGDAGKQDPAKGKAAGGEKKKNNPA